MTNLIFTANVILPLLTLMALGYAARRRGMIDLSTVTQCNALVFKIFLPMVLFSNMRTSTLSTLQAVDFFVFVIIFILLAFALALVFVLLFEKENKKRGVMIQGMVRSNYALFGIPLIALLFPNDDIALASLLIAIVIPMFNVGAVIVLTCFSEKQGNAKNALVGILKNPLIWATFLGFLCLVYDVQFPSFIETSITNLASIATPLALFILGARFEFKRILGNRTQLAIVVSTRLVILPILATTAAALMGFRGVELGCIMVLSASPTGVSSYTMAELLGGDGDLAAAIVVFTSALCIFTLFIGIFIVKSLQLI